MGSTWKEGIIWLEVDKYILIKIIISEKSTTIKNPISKYSSADSGSEWETEEELDDSGIKIEDDLDDSGVKFEDAEVI